MRAALGSRRQYQVSQAMASFTKMIWIYFYLTEANLESSKTAIWQLSLNSNVSYGAQIGKYHNSLKNCLQNFEILCLTIYATDGQTAWEQHQCFYMAPVHSITLVQLPYIHLEYYNLCLLHRHSR